MKSKVARNNLFLALNLILSIVTMALVLFLITRMLANDYTHVAVFLGTALASQVVHQFLSFLVITDKKVRLRLIIVGCIYFLAALFAFISIAVPSLLTVSTIITAAAMGTNQFLVAFLDKKGKLKSIISIIFGLAFIGLGIAAAVTTNENEIIYVPLVAAILLLASTVRRLLLPTIRYDRVKLFVSILIKTHTIDVLICLLSFIVAFSFMFPMVEENIKSFWDAMWYCFTVITTIGFGDFYATSVIGRILTVILGIYGIAVVAVFTSVIVNYYNEVSAKDKDKNPDDYID